MHRHFIHSFVVFSLAAGLASRPAQAATPTAQDADLARIQVLAETARRQRQAGDYVGAIESLEAALAIASAPWLIYSLGRVYEDAKRYDLARAHYIDAKANAPDAETRQRAIDGLARIANLEKPIAPEPPAKPEPTPDEPPADDGTHFGAWPWVLLGTGAAAATVGVILFVDGHNDWSNGTATRDPALIDAGTPKVNAGGALMAVGGGLVAGAVVMWLLEDPAEPIPTALLTPTVGPDNLGLSFTGSF